MTTITQLNALYERTGRPITINSKRQFCGLGQREVWTHE